MKRRIFAIVLSCLMVLSVLPVAAFAEDAVCEHEYVETVLKAPTCEEEGVKKITCKKCDLKATYEKIDAHPLNEGTVIEAATCGEAGSIKYACTVCDYTVVKDIPATGEHIYDNDRDAVCNACYAVRRMVDSFSFSNTRAAKTLSSITDEHWSI